MARTASHAGVGPRVLPRGAEAFLRRRLCELAGLVLIAAGGALTAAFVSYAPADPSFNTAIAAPARNLLGGWGAAAADLVIQAVGLAGLLPGLVLAAWGVRLAGKASLRPVWPRLAALVAAMALTSVALAAVPPPHGWPLVAGLGGAAGAIAWTRLAASMATFLPMLPALAPVAILGAAAMAALMAAAGVSLKGVIVVLRGVLRLGGLAAVAAWRGGRAAGESVAAWRERREPTFASPGADDVTADGDAGEGTGLRAPTDRTDLVAPREPRPRTGRRARAQRQGTLDLDPAGDYRPPPLDLLDPPTEGVGVGAVNAEALERNARLLESVLEDFGVHGEVVKVRPGPVVTLYEFEPAPGTKTSRVIGLADDIARSMSAISVRIAVIPGRNVIGLELPNARRDMVSLRELLASETFERATGRLTLALGKDIGGGPVTVDLARMPHLLIAGTTGSGKSVALNTMILALLYQHAPESCRFIMIDPKMLELSVYDGIPHLLCPVVTEPTKAVVALKWTVREMEERYRTMAQLGVRNIAGYNGRLAEALKKGETLTRRVQIGFDAATGQPQFEDQPLSMDPLPLIVVVVDEMADLMLVAGKDIEAAVQRLSQMARAAGIHLIMATQRPSVDVITGTIKANFPTRISFQVTSKIDSRTILGEQGAEQLLGQGDMLYMVGGGRITRVHGPFVSDDEVERMVSFLKRLGEPDYVDAVTEELDAPGGGFAVGDGDDSLYDQAVALVAREGKASTSFVQRHLQIGYNRAARIIEQMEAEGVVSKANRVGRREVLVARSGDHAA